MYSDELKETMTEGWSSSENDFDVANNRHYESTFALGTGYVTVRYSIEEGFEDDGQKVDRKAWRLTNGLKERTVPFQIEDNGTFFKDVIPELQCEGEIDQQ